VALSGLCGHAIDLPTLLDATPRNGAGSSLHFQPMNTCGVGGLKVTASDPNDLDVTLGARHWHFSIDTPSRLRFAVLGNAFAAGRALGELDFAQWGVVVERLERDGARFDPDAAFVLRSGDFLYLCGSAPALTRAWHTMNDGPRG
jgi:hypothetical protein